MSSCQVCGEDKFDLVDGHYYCRICQTQSQVFLLAIYFTSTVRSIDALIWSGFPLDLEKNGKMGVHLENLEISWNFEKCNKYHGKIISNLENWVANKNTPLSTI